MPGRFEDIAMAIDSNVESFESRSPSWPEIKRLRALINDKGERRKVRGR